MLVWELFVRSLPALCLFVVKEHELVVPHEPMVRAKGLHTVVCVTITIATPPFAFLVKDSIKGCTSGANGLKCCQPTVIETWGLLASALGIMVMSNSLKVEKLSVFTVGWSFLDKHAVMLSDTFWQFRSEFGTNLYEWLNQLRRESNELEPTKGDDSAYQTIGRFVYQPRLVDHQLPLRIVVHNAL